MKKSVIWVCGLACMAALSFPAYADQSIGYQKYYQKGVRAFNDHDDQDALRFFKIAQIYDPYAPQLQDYLAVLKRRGVVLPSVESHGHPWESEGYKYYMDAGIKAYKAQDNKDAIHYFKIAKIYWPASKEAQDYLKLLGVPQPPVSPAVAPPAQVALPVVQAQAPPVPAQVPVPVTVPAVQQPQPLPQSVVQQPPQVTAPAAVSVAVKVQPTAPQPAAVPVPSAPQSAPTPVQVAIIPLNPKEPPPVLSLAQLTNNGQVKGQLQIDIHSGVIIEGAGGIRQFLVTSEGFIQVKRLDANRLEIDAVRIGQTFLHIWDAFGLHTLFVEVVFPKSISRAVVVGVSRVRHAQPFIVTYANDWSTYYQGKNFSQLKRQSYDFNETLGITGETPYGFLDASGTYEDFNSFSRFNTYTIGLSQIPLEGTSNFNVRGFDAFRYMSPLTLPGTHLRGAFADVDLMDNMLGLSVGHGQEELPPGFFTSANLSSPYLNAYIDAVKLTLWPQSHNDQLSLNFATAYGKDRALEPYLTNHVYSVQGMHRFNEFLTLNAEEANDTSHDSQLASLQWQRGSFLTALNFRNIDKNYSTVSTLPANQGETGATWVVQADGQKYSLDSFIEAYQEHLYANPDNPRAFNYDGNSHLRADINPNVWTDTDFNFVDSPGLLSPMRNVNLNQRISRGFQIFNGFRAVVFGGAGYEYSHASGSDFGNYDKEDVIAGVQLPLTNHWSVFANDEYDWLNQQSFGHSNPDIINSGIEFQKQFTPKFSVTSQAVYRNELGVDSQDSILSGQESVMFSSSFNYNPTPDLSVFLDGDASRVLYHTGSEPYDDFEAHVGMRITFGGATYWDPLGTVMGTVFKDKTGTGKFEKGDEGVAGIKIQVGDKVVTTDKNGRYRIRIRAKGVQVTPQLDSIPAGYIFSTPQTLNIDILQGRTVHADFGLVTQTGIYGIVFVDKTGTGIPNDNDRFIGKVRIILDGKIVQKSDAHGSFYFRNVSPGEHTITIDINSLALDMLPKVKLKSKINVVEGTNYVFNIPVVIKKAVQQD
ncbi:MAG: hypothetical protein KGJ09_02195 [Candidatus Omnitrophica bacterium]|nr:hypothetical protein [Candidatus Omnitrophota bacterium]MDE2008869.1 hypothetical protein [Candidatus Omnitrophota bacterium]MDE2213568.1 hypothetical protein [Candidatus Omnitrophota bacterium]MDE2230531.1 hypothetical protein [Candidatus Omnitrophota bacterium]